MAPSEKTLNFTDRWIAALDPPGTGQVEFFDGRTPGLALRVSYGGTRSFIFYYRFNGRRRKTTLGRYPTLPLVEARRRAALLTGQVADGRDPGAEKKARRMAETVEDLVEQFMEEHAIPTKKTARIDRSIFDRDVLPVIGNLKIVDVKRADIKALLKRIVGRGSPHAANRTLMLVHKLFNFAIQEELTESNPAHLIPKPARPRARDRHLSDDEIRAVWNALDEVVVADVAAIIRLLLLTGQRQGEVYRMRWEDLDLEGERMWVIPDEFTKNGKTHRVPLSPPAVDIVKAIGKMRRRGPWVFPAAKAPDRPTFRSRTAKPLPLLFKVTGVAEFRLHDLRHTTATNVAKLGFDDFAVGTILNHTNRTVTSRYQHYSYDREKREALNRWASHLMKIIGLDDGRDNVVELPRHMASEE